MRPIDAVTLAEAARILGTSISSTHRLVLAGRLPSYADRPYEQRTLSQADVEQLACELYDWRAHRDAPTAYWIAGKEAAAMMGVSGARMRQLASQDRLPYVVHRSRVRLYRRAQLGMIARHRDL